MEQAILNFFSVFLSDKYADIVTRALMYTLKGMLCVFVVVAILIIVVLLLNIVSATIDNKKAEKDD